MVKIKRVLGYESFKKIIQPYEKTDLVYCFFVGTKNKHGKSWCSVCNEAEPVVLVAVKKYAKKQSVLVYTEVGEKEEYFDKGNPFKADTDIRLKLIPAIQRWKYPWALRGVLCTREAFLKKFFEKHAD